MGIKKKLKRFLDKDDKYFGLFYHLIICIVFVLIGVIGICTFKPFNYVAYNQNYVLENHVEGILAQLSSGACLAFGLGLLFVYLGENDYFSVDYVLTVLGYVLIILSFVCMCYNIFRPEVYIVMNSRYIGEHTPSSIKVEKAIESLSTPANRARLIILNPALPLVFAVAMLSYAATEDGYLGRLIAIAISIVLSYIIPLIAVILNGVSWLILVYPILLVIGLIAVICNKNSWANFELHALLSLFSRRSSSGTTSSGGKTGDVRYSSDAEKCVISAMNSVKGITTSTSLYYGVKVKFYPDIYVDRTSITITINYSLSGGGELTENKLQEVQRQFSAAAERYAENISKRAKEKYEKCKSQRSYTLNTQMGTNM